MFRQNGTPFDEKLENLCILFSDDAESCTATIANLPTNAEGLNALASYSPVAVTVLPTFQVHQMYAVFWLETNGYVCYLG